MSIKKQMLIYSILGLVPLILILYVNICSNTFLICCFFLGFVCASQNIGFLFLQKNFFWIFFLILWMKDNNAPKGIRIPWKFLNRLFNRKHRGVVGCNFSVAKKDIFAVNGFDMRYHWAGTGEDSDIEYRLNLHGVRSLPLCHKAIQYHLWHRLQHRHTEPEVLFAEVKKLQQKVTPAGLQILKAMNEL
jgi:hypothetical protein